MSPYLPKILFYHIDMEKLDYVFLNIPNSDNIHTRMDLRKIYGNSFPVPGSDKRIPISRIKAQPKHKNFGMGLLIGFITGLIIDWSNIGVMLCSTLFGGMIHQFISDKDQKRAKIFNESSC